MGALQKYTPFFISALLMWVVLSVIYPHYQYYIDPDGTAYLTISQRYANGDYARAVNGYWSPWSCWLTALLIKTRVAAIPASVIINALGATGFLYISQSFFLKFTIIPKLQWLFSITLALFLCYAVYWQSFDDLWECFFLLATLRLMLADGYTKKPVLWVLCGVLGTLAYFAKAYALPFFILNTLCCVYFICKDNKARWLTICCVFINVITLCSLPWIIALHNKYGIWTTSTAGSLNMSWYLVGHPYWKDGIAALLPPPHPGSPYYWEDPWFVNGATPHFWDSWSLFARQLLKIGHNLYKLAISMFQLSLVFPFIMVILVKYIGSKKTRNINSPSFIVAFSCLLFPLGYLLINYEARYLWYMLPLSLVAAGLFIQNHIIPASEQHLKPILSKAIPYLIAASFLAYPAYGMYTMYDTGADAYKMAQELKQLNVHGSFTTIAEPGAAMQRMERLAYFSGNQLYTTPKLHLSDGDLLKEMRRYHINYFIVYDESAYSAELNNRDFMDENQKPFPASYHEIKGVRGGIKIFTVNP